MAEHVLDEYHNVNEEEDPRFHGITDRKKKRRSQRKRRQRRQRSSLLDDIEFDELLPTFEKEEEDFERHEVAVDAVAKRLSIGDLKMPNANYSSTETWMNKFIHKMNEVNGQATRYEGATPILNLFMSYLYLKYNHNCFSSGGKFALPIFVDEKKRRQKPDAENIIFAEGVCRCIVGGMKMIVLPVNISLVLYNDNVGTPAGHLNVLVYREKFHTFEHFEPHGRHFFNEATNRTNILIMSHLETFVTLVNKCLAKNKIQPIRFVHSSKTCSDSVRICKHGFQALENASTLPMDENIEGGGYCAAWSMFFMELCFKNPGYSNGHILKLVNDIFIQHSGEGVLETYLRRVIQGYSYFIDEKITKYFTAIFGKHVTVKMLLDELFDPNGTPSQSYMNILEIINDFMDIHMTGKNTEAHEAAIREKITTYTSYLTGEEGVDELNDENKLLFQKAILSLQRELQPLGRMSIASVYSDAPRSARMSGLSGRSEREEQEEQEEVGEVGEVGEVSVQKKQEKRIQKPCPPGQVRDRETKRCRATKRKPAKKGGNKPCQTAKTKKRKQTIQTIQKTY